MIIFPKKAEITVIILHKGITKVAGTIKFDAAMFANQGLKVKSFESPLENCPDPTAKLKYEIRVHSYGDYSNLEIEKKKN